MATQLKTGSLLPPIAPRLPSSPIEYDQRFMDEFIRILRIYFNTLDNFDGALLAVNGGGLLKFPYGAFHQDGDTTLTGAMTNVSTTAIQVVSTTGFPLAGYLLIEDEIVQYTGITATTFTGITRGVKASTNKAHAIGTHVTEIQAGAANAIQTMIFTNTDFSNNVYLDSPVSATKVYFDYSGIYNIQFSSQFLTYDAAEDDVKVWFRQNGVDVPLSAGIIGIPRPHSTYPGSIIVTWNIYLQINAGDDIELCWTSLTGNTVLATIPAFTTPVVPSSPSTILTVTFVSALPT